MRTALAVLTAISLAGCNSESSNPVDETEADISSDLRPDGKGLLTREAHASFEAMNDLLPAARPGKGNGINYHGGPVITGTADIYYIWYGAWAGNTATTILPDFISHLGGSSYEHINTTYYNSAGTHVSGNIAYKGSYSTSAYLGTSLSDAQILKVVTDALSGNHLPYDSNAIYFVLTAKEVNASSGFCSQYCGWHDSGTSSKGKVRYAFVGNPDRCPSSCEEQTTSPNSNAGADGMASIIAHESEEAISDPDINAWYDAKGEENADKCAWTFGTEKTASNGSKYNITLGSRNYLIQQNWVNASGGYCAMSY
jgi:Phosphate-induced protein 1 conserved region